MQKRKKDLKDDTKEWNKIVKTLQQKGVSWIFNPPSGAHHSGIWERLIRLVKKTLSSFCRQQTLDGEGLHTVLREVEAIFSSRPLSTVSDNLCDLELLTPNHLLQLKIQPNLPPDYQDADGDKYNTSWICSGHDG